jgi:hypothetical protein
MATEHSFPNTIGSVLEDIEHLRQKWNVWSNNHHSRDSQIREGYQLMVSNLKQKFESEATFQREKCERDKEALLLSLEGKDFQKHPNKSEEKERLQAKATENLFQLASENMELKEKIQSLYSQLDDMSHVHEQEVIGIQKSVQKAQSEYEKRLNMQAEEHRVTQFYLFSLMLKSILENTNRHWEREIQSRTAQAATELQNVSDHWRVKR